MSDEFLGFCQTCPVIVANEIDTENGEQPRFSYYLTMPAEVRKPCSRPGNFLTSHGMCRVCQGFKHLAPMMLFNEWSQRVLDDDNVT